MPQKGQTCRFKKQVWSSKLHKTVKRCGGYGKTKRPGKPRKRSRKR